jgi:hypothetical protein
LPLETSPIFSAHRPECHNFPLLEARLHTLCSAMVKPFTRSSPTLDASMRVAFGRELLSTGDAKSASQQFNAAIYGLSNCPRDSDAAKRVYIASQLHAMQCCPKVLPDTEVQKFIASACRACLGEYKRFLARDIDTLVIIHITHACVLYETGQSSCLDAARLASGAHA